MKALVLFGAGRNAAASFYMFSSDNWIPICICDNDQSKINTQFVIDGFVLEVISPECVMKRYPDAAFYITPDPPQKFEIIEQLLNNNIDISRILNYEPFCYLHSCDLIGKSINFTPTQLHHCCSASNGVKPPLICDFHGGGFPQNRYVDSVNKLISANNSEYSPCEGCRNFHEGYFSVQKFPINSISINSYMHCNLHCSYCRPSGWVKGQYGWWDMHESAVYSIADTLIGMYENKIISQSTQINWGGGEPVLAKNFSDCMKMLAEKGIKQIINTNATIYSESITEVLLSGLIQVQVSVDAGTPLTYFSVKGEDLYYSVWDTIAKYAKVNSSSITVKYIVIEENSGEKDFLEFINQCDISGVKNIAITPEYNLLWRGHYSDSLVRKIIDLYLLLQKRGFITILHTDYFSTEQKDIIFNSINGVEI